MIAAAELPKIRLSRDFGCGPIFDFCNTIPSISGIVGQISYVWKVPILLQKSQKA